MGIIYEADIEGLEHCYVEVCETWSRREVNVLRRSQVEAVREELRPLERELQTLAAKESLNTEEAERLAEIERLARRYDEEMEAARARDGEIFFHYWRKKVEACHLERPGQEPLTDPAELDGEVALDDLDMRLIGFVGTVLMLAIRDLQQLGPLAARRRSPGSDSRPTRKTSQTDPA